MADTTSGAPWSNWEALNRQYWKAWTEQAAQGAAQAPGKLGWHEGLELWSRMFEPSALPTATPMGSSMRCHGQWRIPTTR